MPSVSVPDSLNSQQRDIHQSIDLSTEVSILLSDDAVLRAETSESVSPGLSGHLSPNHDLSISQHATNLEDNVDLFESFGTEDFGLVIHDCDDCIDCVCVGCDTCAHIEGDEKCVHCGKCDPDLDNSSVSECSDSDSDSEEETPSYTELEEDFKSLALDLKLNHKQISGLLTFYRRYGFGNFPKCAKTLLRTPMVTTLKPVSPGQYWHRGITKDLESYVKATKVTEVNITFGVDGLPISKSSGSCFWPILCYFNDSDNVVLAGVYHGNEKPADHYLYLRDFIDEILHLSQGFYVEGRPITVRLTLAICDAPAKAFILNVMGHNATVGCTKCQTTGKMFGRRMSYPKLDVVLRTDENFRSQSQKDYHKGNTILAEIPGFDLVSSVVLDYLHLVLLGALRKMMYMWVSGPLRVRLSKAQLQKISEKLISISSWAPYEFARKPRSLKFLKRYKGTEYRQMLLYTGILIFRGTLRDDVYEHFLGLHVAIYMLAHPQLCKEHALYVQELLVFWVHTFARLYGKEYVSHNIHGLIHLPIDVLNFGPLDSFSAFKFENFLQVLKKMMRKGDKPLQQLVNRFIEAEQAGKIQKPWMKEKSSSPTFSRIHSNGPLTASTSAPQYSVCQLPANYTLNAKSNANNCCMLEDKSVILVFNFAVCSITKAMVVIGKKFRYKDNAYTSPINSSELEIYEVFTLDRHFKSWPVENIYLSYHLVDFSEGPQIIPSNWLADDGCTCAWPHWADDLDQNAWDKAIRQLIEPQGHWKEAVIQRIRIKNSNFPYVRSKLKEAEEKSDTDLQSDAACGPNRQLRKRKVEDDECFIPKLPKFQSVKTQIDGEFERLSFPPSPHSSPSSTLANTPSSLRRSNSGTADKSVTTVNNGHEGGSITPFSTSKSGTSGTSDKSVPTVSNGHKGGSITPSYTSKSGTSGTPNMMSLESPAQSNKPNRDSRTLSAQPSCSGTADKSVTTVNNGHEGGSITPFSTSKSGTSGIPSESAESPVHDSVLNSSDQAAWSRVPPHAAGVSDGSAESPMDESLSHPNISRDTSGKRVRESNVTPSSTIKERTMAMAESMTNVDNNSNNSTNSQLMYGLPADNAFEWDSFHQKILDKTYSTALVKELKRYKDDNFAGTARNILGAVVSNKFASEFSLCGSNGKKKAFKESGFYKEIFPATLKKLYPNFTDKSMKLATENWLRLAPQRSGGQNFKKYKKKSTPRAETDEIQQA
ncbi:hypothetical protein FOCC_FOCC016228 [Frankliniella occidentalis]|nr:hypothetical protein FOCC_FOCC016228 [Frankliniella occidentalis]